MDIDPQEFADQYASLSDEGLLAIDRRDLVEIAQQYYDAEISRRGLKLNAPPQSQDPSRATIPGTDVSTADLVPVGTFLSYADAGLAREVLRSAEIPAYLESEFNPQATVTDGLRLMVPEPMLEQAQEVLDSQISDEELAAQAEAAAPAEDEEAEDTETD